MATKATKNINSWKIDKALPKSASLVTTDLAIKEHGLESIAEAFLLDRFGVSSLNELLDQNGVYEFVEYMKKFIAEQEDRDIG